MIESFLKKQYPFLVLFFATICIPLFWYDTGDIIYFWDQTFPLNPSEGLKALLSAWHTEFDFGRSDAPAFAFIPFFAITAGLQSIFNDISIVQQIIYSGLFFIAGSSFFILSNLIIGRIFPLINKPHARFASLLATLFYLYNPYSLFFLWRIINSTLFIYAFLPLLLYSVIQLNIKYTLRNTLLFAVSLIFISPGLSNITFLPVLFILSLSIVYAAKINIFTQKGIISMLFVFLFSLYWILPILSSINDIQGSGSYGGVKNALLSNSENLSIENTIQFLGHSPLYESFKNEYNYSWVEAYRGDNSYFITIFRGIIILFIAIAIFIKKNKFLFFLGGMFVFFLFFAKGTGDPFGHIFLSIFENINFFTAYRDPFSKFGFGMLFLFSLLLGLSFVVFLEKVKHIFLRIIVSIILLIPIFINGIPLINGKVVHEDKNIRPSGNINIPEDYIKVQNIIKENIQSGKILTFPQQELPILSSKWDKGMVGFDPIRTLTYHSTISTLSGNQEKEEFISSLYQQFYTNPDDSIQTLPQIGIEWILIRKDNNDLFSKDRNFDISKVIQTLSLLDDVELIFSGENISLYRLKTHSSHISSFKDTKSIKTETSGERIFIPVYNNKNLNTISTSTKKILDFKNFTIDAGDQNIITTIKNNTLLLENKSFQISSLKANISESIIQKRYIGVEFSSFNKTAITISASQYKDDIFQVGQALHAINPPLYSSGKSYYSPSKYFLIFDIKEIPFLPTHLHINIGSIDANKKEKNSLAIHNISFFNIKNTLLDNNSYTPLAFHLPPKTEKIVIDIPVYKHIKQKKGYLSFDIKTNNSSFQLGLSQKKDGQYIDGKSVSNIYNKSISLTENGTIMSKNKWERIHFPIDTNLYNNIHFNLFSEGTLPILEIKNIKFSTFSGSKYDVLRQISECKNKCQIIEDESLSKHTKPIDIHDQYSPSPSEYIFNTSLPSLEKKEHYIFNLNQFYSHKWDAILSPCLYDKNDTYLAYLFCTIQSPKYKLPKDQHIMSNGYSNTWIFNPDEIPQSIKTLTNQYSIIISFRTQTIFYIGSILSLLSLFTLLFFAKRIYRSSLSRKDSSEKNREPLMKSSAKEE